ncbi:MAG TPA: hypothetical protein VM187_03315 [Niastella sp.]|nr:hypothetical protein [Niastella sp.]
MNLKHPYEKHLAEKLVQLPPPDDPDQNWQQMKVLLDKNMPRGGGGPKGSFRWWVAGTIIVAILVGTWYGGRSLLSKEGNNESVAGTIKTVNNKKGSAVASTETNVEHGSSGRNNGANNNLPGAAYASTSKSAGNNEAVTNDQQTNTNPTSGTSDAVLSKNEIATTNSSIPDKTLTRSAAEKARSSGSNVSNGNASRNHNKTFEDRNKIYTSGTKNDHVSTGNNSTSNSHSTNDRASHIIDITGNRSGNNTGAANSRKANNKYNKGASNRSNKPGKRSAADVNKPSPVDDVNRYTYKPTITLPPQPSAGTGLKESPVTYDINYTGTSVLSPSDFIQREFTYLFPERDNKKKTTARKPNRTAHSSEDRKFAIGLSLPMGFPVGDQQALAFNRNAGVNTISDYIPSPHFQYHLNNKTYVQAGLQFSAPQFIRPVLLYQDRKVSQPPFVHEQITTWTARKLYYFNLPLTVYHSPLKNFYMGAGLQYSSLLSGVAQYECIERNMVGPMQELTIKNYFTKFRNDSLSNRLNSSEVRLLIDMSYYWSRFTVGLQYSQAFNNYVSFQVTPNSPYTFDKNKSLQFYLRYNIWEDVKRKKPKGQVLTLK